MKMNCELHSVKNAQEIPSMNCRWMLWLVKTFISSKVLTKCDDDTLDDNLSIL